MKKLKLALVGKGITHSRSQQMYEELLGHEIDYSLLDYESDDQIPHIKELLKTFTGISITAPYKYVFIPQVKVEDQFTRLNAINCVGFIDNKYQGTNTDYLAVQELTDNYFNTFSKIILLGDGAMARITVEIFEKMNVKFEQYSRKINKDFSEKIFLSSTEDEASVLVINACGRPYQFTEQLNSNTVFYDYNYSHEYHTNFFKNSVGKYVDGLELLKSQARHALNFWGLNT